MPITIDNSIWFRTRLWSPRPAVDYKFKIIWNTCHSQCTDVEYDNCISRHTIVPDNWIPTQVLTSGLYGYRYGQLIAVVTLFLSQIKLQIIPDDDNYVIITFYIIYIKLWIFDSFSQKLLNNQYYDNQITHKIYVVIDYIICL